jgi:hypothetical protein
MSSIFANHEDNMNSDALFSGPEKLKMGVSPQKKATGAT